jgi:hypothetical protein
MHLKINKKAVYLLPSTRGITPVESVLRFGAGWEILTQVYIFRACFIGTFMLSIIVSLMYSIVTDVICSISNLKLFPTSISFGKANVFDDNNIYCKH